jgi:hypothetical protein
MPEKSVDINGVSVGITVVVGIIASYLFFIVKTIFAKINSAHAELKKDVDHHHAAILDIYTTLNKGVAEQARVEERISALKEVCEKNHRGDK